MIHEPSSAAPKKEYVFNAAQEAWLKALESGTYTQGTGKLLRGVGHCCLGIACEVAQIPKQIHFSGEYYMFDNEIEYAPEQIVESLKLKDSEGEFNGRQLVGQVAAASLVEANDRGATFSEIAAFIRSNPTAVFKE